MTLLAGTMGMFLVSSDRRFCMSEDSHLRVAMLLCGDFFLFVINVLPGNGVR